MSEHKDKHPVTIKGHLYKGMPHVELEFDKPPANKLAEGVEEGPISISLESLDVDLRHGQGYGMVRASMGCISAPQGPSC